ncbi:MAG: hypothetical protein ACRYF0_09690, partial [Janthinobacterium lividum]
MKTFLPKLYTPLLLATGLGAPLASQAQYTPGNLVVLQVGDGAVSSANTATTALLEYTPSGVLQSTIRLNALGSNKLTNTANGNSEGMLTLSADGRYLLTTGYDAVVGTAAATATAAAVPRTIARISSNQNVDISTALPDAFSTNTIRSAASVDGSAFWVAGDGTLRYALAGASSSSVLSTTVSNIRVVRIVRGSVYFSTGAGTRGIYLLGPSSTTSSGQVATLLIGTGATSSPYSFVLLDRSSAVAGPDAAYIADDLNGIQKWAFDGSTWTNVGTITQAARGLTGTVNPDGSVQLYATTRTSAGGNALVAVLDTNPYTAPPSTTSLNSSNTRATAQQNYAFRGVDFAPGTAVVLPVVLTGFAATRTAAGVQVRWATASEINSARFEVERSLDGVVFGPVATVAAAGTSQQPRAYTHLDAAAPTGGLYYRLRQVDLDGTTHYSPVAAVSDAGPGLALSPNPVRESLCLVAEQPTIYTVRSVLGQALLSGTTAAGVTTIAVA